MTPAIDWGASDRAAVDDWYRRTAVAKREALRAVGARLVRDHIEVLDRACAKFLGRWFLGRTRDGVFGIGESWCDYASATQGMARIAFELRREGYRVAFLPTAQSTWCIGMRRPVIVVPPGSDVDPRAIAERLAEAGFQGVEEPPHVVKRPPTRSQ